MCLIGFHKNCIFILFIRILGTFRDLFSLLSYRHLTINSVWKSLLHSCICFIWLGGYFPFGKKMYRGVNTANFRSSVRPPNIAKRLLQDIKYYDREDDSATHHPWFHPSNNYKRLWCFSILAGIAWMKNLLLLSRANGNHTKHSTTV